MLVDSHLHLDDPRFDADRDAVLARARQAGVTAALTIGNGTGPDDMACGLPLARAHEWIYTSVGVHPHDAARMEPRHLEMIWELGSDDRVVAIGETGLDYHYDNSPRPLQREAFHRQLALAKASDLPVIIHTREAEEDTIALLEEHAPVRGVVHCFTGTAHLAERALDMGLTLSFSGILTFPKSGALRAVASGVPDDRLLLETDAPYLAPVPHRGQRNEPAFVAATAALLAGLRGTTPEVLGAVTTENFKRLFGVSF
jgi:TatD DNase family protein